MIVDNEASIDGKLRKKQGTHSQIAIGRPRHSESAKARERNKTTIFAAVERGGRIKATVLPSRHGPALKQQVIEWVEPESIIITDEWRAYWGLDKHFAAHSRINHTAGIYVEGDIHTNTIEGFFGNLKTGIRGNYKRVSRRWLQSYLNEFTWRYNHRYSAEPMFVVLIRRAAVK